VDELRREVQRLREENLTLAKMVTDFLHNLPKPKEEVPPVPEATPPVPEAAPTEPIAAEEVPSGEIPAPQPEPDLHREIGGNPWWRRSRSDTG
jgi:hypothetical protein